MDVTTTMQWLVLVFYMNIIINIIIISRQVFIEHESLELNRRQAVEPIGLDACLKAFTKEEHLGEKELYYCSKCMKHGHAVKKLELWSLPPILVRRSGEIWLLMDITLILEFTDLGFVKCLLYFNCLKIRYFKWTTINSASIQVVHLKRFQLFNNRWVKSQKIVRFPMKNFDPSNYLVQRTHPSSPSSYRCVSSFSAFPSHSATLFSALPSVRDKSLCNGNEQKTTLKELCQVIVELQIAFNF